MKSMSFRPSQLLSRAMLPAFDACQTSSIEDLFTAVVRGQVPHPHDVECFCSRCMSREEGAVVGGGPAAWVVLRCVPSDAERGRSRSAAHTGAVA
eukprot:12208420-Heterocapsa_arctica.AAC.1